MWSINKCFDSTFVVTKGLFILYIAKNDDFSNI